MTIATTINAEKWLEAMIQTEPLCGDVGGFFYAEEELHEAGGITLDPDGMAGTHIVVRDLGSLGKVVLWEQYATAEEYEETHRAMMRQISLEHINIIGAQYLILLNPSVVVSVGKET